MLAEINADNEQTAEKNPACQILEACWWPGGENKPTKREDEYPFDQARHRTGPNVRHKEDRDGNYGARQKGARGASKQLPSRSVGLEVPGELSPNQQSADTRAWQDEMKNVGGVEPGSEHPDQSA